MLPQKSYTIYGIKQKGKKKKKKIIQGKPKAGLLLLF